MSGGDGEGLEATVKLGRAFGKGPGDFAGFAQGAGWIVGGQADAALFGGEDLGLGAAFEEQALLGAAGAAPLFEMLCGGLEAAAVGGVGLGESDLVGEGGGEREPERLAHGGAGAVQLGGHGGAGARDRGGGMAGADLGGEVAGRAGGEFGGGGGVAGEGRSGDGGAAV